MYGLYHNLNTEDQMRSDGAGIEGAVVEALKMWDQERKAIVFEVVLERDNAPFYLNGRPINENIILVEADGRVTPRVVRNAGITVKRFLKRTEDTLGLVANVIKVDAAIKNEAHLPLAEQLQAVIDCLYGEGE